MLALGAGLSLSNAKGVAEALLGRQSEFTRTPKVGDQAQPHPIPGKSRRRTRRTLLLSLAELGLAGYFLYVLIETGKDKLWAAMPMLILFLAGFLWTGGMSLYEMIRERFQSA
jgi:hypothetical protein